MRRYIAVLGTLATLATAAPLTAQVQAPAPVSSTELEAAVVAAPAGNQLVVQRFLQDSRVVEAARGLGVHATDLAAGVATMSEDALSQVAEQTRAAQRDLAGGDSTVVISTTAIIIILLVLILLLK